VLANFHRIIGDKHVHDRWGVELPLLAVVTCPIRDRIVVLRSGDTCRPRSPGPFGVLSPLSGTVVEVNSSLTADPGLVNSAPLGAEWPFKLKLSNAAELALLLDESAYRNLLS
jgi:hypothetical protein